MDLTNEKDNLVATSGKWIRLTIRVNNANNIQLIFNEIKKK